MNGNGNGTKSVWVWAVGAIMTIAIAVGMLTAQWQSAIDATVANQKQIEKLEADHEVDIARLDESNRSRRNDIADLEERIARLEERTGG